MTSRAWLLFAALAAAVCSAANGGAAGTYVSVPDRVVAANGSAVDVERGLFFAPENRRKASSRTIAVHFIRFRALLAEPRREPVFWLPGGPGTETDLSSDTGFNLGALRDIERLRRTRDVIYVSQRGNPRAAGLVPALWLNVEPAALGRAADVGSSRDRVRDGLKRALAEWTSKGVDLSGYDILNIVDDVYELRAALGYDKIVLRGCSFGSQESFSYIKRWPETVDRAFLTGVEPIDYGYDSPQGIWNSMTRLAQAAQADPALAPDIPRGGLMRALESVIERLERAPVTVSVAMPGTTQLVKVTLGADDLRREVGDTMAFMGDSMRASLASWPRFVIELYHGDYRYLAARTLQARASTNAGVLIGALIDNSLGITPQRDALLKAEPAARWLGDVNAFYRDTLDLTPTPDVGNAFRANWKSNVPILMVAGDLDWYTPAENAQAMQPYFANGHVLTVRGGTHCTAIRELPQQLPELAEKLYGFVDTDIASTSPRKYLDILPAIADLPPLRFAPLKPALYEQWLASSGR